MRALRNLRAKLRYRAGQVLARLLAPRRHSSILPAPELRSVLIVRINARMGNTLFLTPLISRLHAELPQARIDLALSNPKGEDLLAGLPGVGRVITFPHKGVDMIPRYLAAVRRLRAERYDLAIDPTPSSTSGRMALALARARFRLGFASADQWAPLTHAVAPPGPRVHQAVQPLLLLPQALGVGVDIRSVRLDLALRPEELQTGRERLAQALARRAGASASGVDPPPAFGFFAYATALKSLDPRYWRAFWEAFLALEPQVMPVEFLPSPQSAPLSAAFASLHVPSPRALSATIAATRLFVSADTGPMHLASATAVPTIALFCASDPALYGPLKPSDLVLEVASCPPAIAAERCRRAWQDACACERERRAARDHGAQELRLLR